jgi:lysozyme family protein
MTPDEIFNIGYVFDRKAEGGFYDDPNAGPTMDGVTQTTFSKWLASEGLPDADVKSITDAQVQAINQEEFWNAPQLPLVAAIAPAVAVSIYDFGENIGYGRKPGRDNPIQMLQRRVGARAVDGILGSQTIDALEAAIKAAGSDIAFSLIYNKDRLAWYEIHSPSVDIKGLDNRVVRLNEYLQVNFDDA